jgi:hypothetical protein
MADEAGAAGRPIETDATMPTLSAPSALSTLTSTSNTRVFGSACAATFVTTPSKRRPGSASVDTVAGRPSASARCSESGAPNCTFTLEVSASTNAGAPGATSEPTSTRRSRMSPSKGARSCASATVMAACCTRAPAACTEPANAW